jgi:N-acetylglutamate synthase-like GNAT family acetyltransferase
VIIMKYGFRTFDGCLYSIKGSKEDIRPTECSLLIRNCLAVPKDMQPSVRELHNLVTPEGLKKKGLAKKLLRLACEEADASNISLLLLVSEDERPKLIKLYELFGFIMTQNDDKACVMIRLPMSAEAVA